MNIYNSSDTFDVSVNTDNSVVIEADRVAHEEIKRSLLPTRIPIMSEEGRNILFEERLNWDLYWLVDPLDGTIEFIQKNDEFAISIAFMHNKTPLFGIIYLPTEGKLYFSDPDRGAFLLEGCDSMSEQLTTSTLFGAAKRLKLERNEDESIDKLNIVITRSHIDEKTNQIIDNFKERYNEVNVINCGSAKKFALIVEGKADFYFRTTPLSDWDIAAGESIVKAYGATIKSNDSGAEITYNKKELVIAPFYVTTLNEIKL